jgi:hypothetical protein
MKSLICSLIVTTLTLCGTPVFAGESPVTFADPNLKAAVQAALGKPNPTPTEMLGLISLAVSNKGIVDLTGLEYATHLTTLDLGDNQINDLSALSGLDGLITLNLWHNQFTDISPLAGLVSLRTLDLNENYVSDISVLSGLPNLTTLWLDETWISDVSPLTSLTMLLHVDLSEDPLDANSYTVHLPQIRSHNPGVTIDYDTYTRAPVYRFWSPENGSHFYTIKESEKDKLSTEYPASVWTYEDIAYYAYPASAEDPLTWQGKWVYRFWSPRTGAHFYTIKEAEKDKLIANSPASVWTFEGHVFSAYPPDRQPAGTVPVYRFWSPKAGSHFFTKKESEKAKLMSPDWQDTWTYEGIAWYSYAHE